MFGFNKAVQAPSVVVYTTDPDQAYRAAWGFTLAEWMELSPEARIDYRDRVAHAPKLHTVSA